jgi:CBS domain containing-hemolysin-like protein
MKFTKEQIEGYLNSQEAQDVITVAAYGIDQTKTEVDNQVIAQVADYADLFAAKLAEIEAENPDGKEVINAALRLAQKIAEKTETKWDDIIINLAAKITGANKEV